MLKCLNEKQKAIFSLILRTLGLSVGITGIIFHMMVNSMLTTGFMVKHNMAYFTLQTNIFSTVIFAVLLIKAIRDSIKTKRIVVSHLNSEVHLACTMYITITMLVYWFILTPMSGFPQNAVLWTDGILLHTCTPLLAIIDSLLFSEHGKVNYKSIPKYLIYPILYYISLIIISKFINDPYYTIKIKGETISLMYPYPFLDPAVMGTKGVIIAIIAAVFLFLLFSLLYIFVDKKIGYKIKH